MALLGNFFFKWVLFYTLNSEILARRISKIFIAPTVVVFSKFSTFYVLNRFSLSMFYRFLQVPDYADLFYQTFLEYYKVQKEVLSRNPWTGTRFFQDRDIADQTRTKKNWKNWTSLDRRSWIPGCKVTM